MAKKFSSRFDQAEVAGRIALAQLNAYGPELEKVLPAEIIRAIKKQRKDITDQLAKGITRPGYTTNELDRYIDPRGYDYENEMVYIDPAYAIASEPGEEAYDPASFSGGFVEAPTQTSKPERPRTVAAAYDPQRSVLTIIFRDSTIYNYYDVSMDEWKAFTIKDTKWQYIRDVLDYKPRGPIDRNAVPAPIRLYAYRALRAAQLAAAERNRKKR